MTEPKTEHIDRLKAEPPGPDGIRTNLVAYIRRLIDDGLYDTPERWHEAEDRLCRKVSEQQ